MARAISLDGVPKPPKQPRSKRGAFEKSDYTQPTGRASYRSNDGSDLPARVLLAIGEYRTMHRRSRTATKVYLGRKEWGELQAILRSELPAGARPVTICGVLALLDTGAESRLEIA